MKPNPHMMSLVAAVAATIGLAAFSTRTAADMPARPGIYTVEQARAGKLAVDASCGQCHLESLRGRVGDPGELPAVESLKPAWEKFVNSSAGQVPPLAGEEFMAKWRDKPIGQFAVDQILGAMHTFGPPGLDAKADKTVFLQITAYVLQKNGAPAGDKPLIANDATPLGAAVHR